jgi:hypothetical protein
MESKLNHGNQPRGQPCLIAMPTFSPSFFMMEGEGNMPPGKM